MSKTNNAIVNCKFKKIKLSLLGPAFVAAIGYIDPGNIITNTQAGSNFGYKLLWVVIWANVMAMFVQLMSAKLGIATDKNLAEHIRDRFPRPIVWFYWVQAEIIVMATDMAEFIGAALGFKLLFGFSLLTGAILTGISSFLILILQKNRKKILETIIICLLLFVVGTYVIELFISHPNIHSLFKGMIVPSLPSSDTVFFAAGILGATIMPHVIYLHSSLTQSNIDNNTKTERYESAKLDVYIAMTIAGFVNLAMMAIAASTFYIHKTNIIGIDQIYLSMKPLLGNIAATIFAISLLASGISSTIVGTMAGQVVMQGFVYFYIPLWVRRIITMLPSFIVIIIGWNPTYILLCSQVLLSFGITLALVPLLWFTGNPKVVGHDMVNSRLMKNIGFLIIVLVVILNGYLIIGQFLFHNKLNV